MWFRQHTSSGSHKVLGKWSLLEMLPMSCENENPGVRRCCMGTRGNLNLSFIDYFLSLFLRLNDHLASKSCTQGDRSLATCVLKAQTYWDSESLQTVRSLCCSNADSPLFPRKEILCKETSWAVDHRGLFPAPAYSRLSEPGLFPHPEQASLHLGMTRG